MTEACGWCAGQDVKPWTYDISQWIDWAGNQNSLRYQGLYNGQNYVPQNEQSGANQNIHANIWIVYYSNITTNGSAQLDESSDPIPPTGNDDRPQDSVEFVREEECTSRDD